MIGQTAGWWPEQREILGKRLAVHFHDRPFFRLLDRDFRRRKLPAHEHHQSQETEKLARSASVASMPRKLWEEWNLVEQSMALYNQRYAICGTTNGLRSSRRTKWFADSLFVNCSVTGSKSSSGPSVTVGESTSISLASQMSEQPVDRFGKRRIAGDGRLDLRRRPLLAQPVRNIRHVAQRARQVPFEHFGVEILAPARIQRSQEVLEMVAAAAERFDLLAGRVVDLHRRVAGRRD